VRRPRTTDPRRGQAELDQAPALLFLSLLTRQGRPQQLMRKDVEGGLRTTGPALAVRELDFRPSRRSSLSRSRGNRRTEKS
jgi:hypothetical protein